MMIIVMIIVTVITMTRLKIKSLITMKTMRQGIQWWWSWSWSGLIRDQCLNSSARGCFPIFRLAGSPISVSTVHTISLVICISLKRQNNMCGCPLSTQFLYCFLSKDKRFSRIFPRADVHLWVSTRSTQKLFLLILYIYFSQFIAHSLNCICFLHQLFLFIRLFFPPAFKGLKILLLEKFKSEIVEDLKKANVQVYYIEWC